MRFSLFARRMEKTDAASVEAMTDPMRKLRSHGSPRMKWMNPPVKRAVTTTPALESTIAGAATGFAMDQFVPKPP